MEKRSGNRRAVRKTKSVHKDPLWTLQNFVIGILFMLLFICVATTVTLNFKQLYYYDIDHLNIPAMSGILAEEARLNYDVLIDYNSMFNHEELNFPTLAMSEHGRIHFEEVKAIFVGMQKFMIIDLILCIGIILYKRKKASYSYLKMSGIVSVLLPTFCAGAIATNWWWFFVTFHHIAFDNDYWIFDAQYDPVITILPDEFFMHCAIMIVSMVLVFAAGSFIIGCLAGKKKR